MTGLPVIATRHAGLGEVIDHGVSGLLVDESEVEGMAAAMARVIESPGEAGRMGVGDRRQALDHHTSSRYIQQLGSVLESLGSRSDFPQLNLQFPVESTIPFHP